MTLKQSILNALETSRDAPLSGQALAKCFGVSRSAIWKAVTALREDGYQIESTQNRGYQLAPDYDRSSETTINALLPGITVPVYCMDTLDSTNNEARRRLLAGEVEPFAIVSEEQTAGRGRRGKLFHSPRGAGLYMTVALAPGQTLSDALGVTLYAATCTADAIERVTGRETYIKWVNDLYWQGRKVGGILTEAITDFESGTVLSLLVGIGLNLYPAVIPTELQSIMGSLACQKPVKNALAAEIMRALLAYNPEATEHLPRYRARCMTLGRLVTCTLGEQRFAGIAESIDEKGALLVRTADGNLHRLQSGEAHIMPD